MTFDIIFMVIFCWAAYRGYTKGFILQSATLVALILGIWGAVNFSDYTAGLIAKQTGSSGEYLPLVAFAITFIAIVIGIHFLAKILEKLLAMIALSFLNRIFGILFNLAKYAFLISAILVIINAINGKTNFIPSQQLKESKLYHPLSAVAPIFFPKLIELFKIPDKPDDAPKDEQTSGEVLA